LEVFFLLHENQKSKFQYGDRQTGSNFIGFLTIYETKSNGLPDLLRYAIKGNYCEEGEFKEKWMLQLVR